MSLASLSTEQKLVQHIFDDLLPKKSSFSELKENIFETIQLINTKQLLTQCFSVEASQIADKNFVTVNLWVQRLTGLFNSAPIRHETQETLGLSEAFSSTVLVASELIRVTVNQSEAAFFIGVQPWSVELLKCLTKKNLDSSSTSSVLKTLSLLFQKTKDRPELQREITNNILPQFNIQLLNLLESKPNCPKKALLEALFISISSFPKTFRTVANRLKKTLISSWLSNDPDCAFLLSNSTSSVSLAHVAFNCLAHLCLVEKSPTLVAEAWGNQLQSLVATGHSLLNTLLAPAQERVYTEISASFPFGNKNLSAESEAVFGGQYDIPLTQFRLTCHAIVCFLSFKPTIEAPTPLSVPIDELMNIICRVYSVSYSSPLAEGAQPKAYLKLMATLQTIHSATHDILLKLSSCLGYGFLEQSKLVSDIVQKLLHLSQKQSSVRRSAYSLIYHLVENMGDCILYHALDGIINALLSDLVLTEPSSNEVSFSSLAANQSKKGKRAVLSNSDAIFNADSNKVLIPGPNYSLALNILELCLKKVSFSFEAEARARIDALLYRHVSLGTTEQLKLDDTQQLALLRTLLAAMVEPSASQAILVEAGLYIFSSLLHHPDLKVRQFCAHALAGTNVLTHPQLPHVSISFNMKTAILNQSEISDKVIPKIICSAAPLPLNLEEPIQNDTESLSQPLTSSHIEAVTQLKMLEKETSSLPQTTHLDSKQSEPSDPIMIHEASHMETIKQSSTEQEKLPSPKRPPTEQEKPPSPKRLNLTENTSLEKDDHTPAPFTPQPHVPIKSDIESDSDDEIPPINL